MTKVTAAVITSMIMSLQDTLPIFNLEIRIASSDAAGCNWVLFGDTLSTHTFCDALSWQTLNEYPFIDCNDRCLMKDPVTGQWFNFVPDIPHLTKNVFTCLELSSLSESKQKMRMG